MTNALRPWTIDFHVAQNDATVYGSGTHDKTGRHCLPLDPNGKLDIVAPRRLLAARRERSADAGVPAHLLGRLHVPERDDDEAEHLERRAAADDRRPRRARLELARRRWTIGGPERPSHEVQSRAVFQGRRA